MVEPTALRCSFCLRPHETVGKLMSSADPSPARAYICDNCARSLTDLTGSYEPSDADLAYRFPTPRVVPDAPHCALCLRTEEQIGELIRPPSSVSKDVLICRSCGTVCLSILEDDETP